MNFFEEQAKAQKRSGKLLLLFALAVILLIISTTLALEVLLHTFYGNAQQSFWQNFNFATLGLVALVISGVVFISAMIKQLQLRRGGSAVAEMLNAQRINRNSQDVHERRVLNIVDEMALASGIPSPPVYVMEENSINAFAAGHDPKDAAIGITRGAMMLLNRDELQGVIAHEFSHIFNGDMKLNIRLLGWLHGILVISLIGRSLLNGSAHASSRRRNSNGNQAGGIVVLLTIAFTLVVIGWIGSAIGHLIRAAVSRQREYLADATAVKYTRNPEGIGGALLKIGGLGSGSILLHPKADQLEHFFINQCHSKTYSRFSSHPELGSRIRAILPRWDGSYPKVDTNLLRRQFDPVNPDHVHLINGQAYVIDPNKKPVPQSITNYQLTAHHLLGLVDNVGSPNEQHLLAAIQTRAAIPEVLISLANTANGARAILHALFASHNPNMLEDHAALLRPEGLNGDLLQYSEHLVNDVAKLPASLRLPLVDLCIASLTTLDVVQKQNFLQLIDQQIALDHYVSLLEWSLARVIREHLLPNKRLLPSTLSMRQRAARTVIYHLADLAHSEPADKTEAYRHAARLLQLNDETCQWHNTPTDWAAMDRALHLLQSCPALQMPRLLRAFTAAIAQREQHYTIDMVEALRAIADTLDCPIPPIINPENTF